MDFYLSAASLTTSESLEGRKRFLAGSHGESLYPAIHFSQELECCDRYGLCAVISQLIKHVPGVSSILTICERAALHMERG